METAPEPNLTLLDLHPRTSDFLSDVREGLRSSPRTLPCKYFYDAHGSKLFDQICELEEYYPTRTEVGILETNIAEIVTALERDVLLVEFGSGSSTKTRILLDHLPEAAGYVPIDISRSHLMEAARSIASRYPRLEVLPVCADFTQPIALPEPTRTAAHRVVFFPGSTIGNFTRDETLGFLRTVVGDCGEGGGLLIGIDLRKDPARLVRAYDDSSGVTAAFNLNLLRRINRELGADFHLDSFEHRAVWNGDLGRMEMHLVCDETHDVTVGGELFTMSAGETLHTENSHKYSVDEFAAVAHQAGLALDRVWTDPAEDFSVHLYWVA